MTKLFAMALCIIASCSFPAFGQGEPHLLTGAGNENELIRMLTVPENAIYLKLSTNQIDKIEAHQREQSALRNQKIIATMKDRTVDRDEILRRVGIVEEETAAATRTILDEVLTPAQFNNLRLLYVRKLIDIHGLKGLFEYDDLVEFLRLPPQLKKNLQVQAARLDQEYRLEIAELRRKQLRALVDGRLDSEQRQKLSKIIGEDLNADDSDSSKRD